MIILQAQMHSFQTSFSSNPATSEALDHSAFLIPARNTAGSSFSLMLQIQLPFLIVLQTMAFHKGLVLNALFSLRTQPLKNLTITSGMANISLVRHFNLMPGSSFSTPQEFLLERLNPNEDPYPLKTDFSLQLSFCTSENLETIFILFFLSHHSAASFSTCPASPHTVSN